MDAKALRLMVAVDDKLTEEQVSEQLLIHVSDDKKAYVLICDYCLSQYSVIILVWFLLSSILHMV